MSLQTSPSTAMPDVQSSIDTRKMVIDRVGVRGVKMPIQVQTVTGSQPSVATFDLDVMLPAEQKGTHMSRFIALLESDLTPISPASLGTLTKKMLTLLEANQGQIDLRFPYFREKTAPVSQVKSLMDYEVSFTAKTSQDNVAIEIKVLVPVTSLCPCSKKISDYGAHNQRSHIIIHCQLNDNAIDTLKIVDELIDIAESQASCELWGILKRPDEKYVTERAYDNPKFVEDLVRDVAIAVEGHPHIKGYCISAENFESIHNHSAYAVINRLHP